MSHYKFKHNKLKNKNTFKAAYYNEKPLIYSFKYFNIDKNKKDYYDPKSRDRDDLFNFLAGCKKICDYTWRELRQLRQFHCHDIENGFKFSSQELEGWQPMQIKLPDMKQGRLIGFIDEEYVFNVVKFDKNHTIYPDKTR